jgi:hypothetical protein
MKRFVLMTVFVCALPAIGYSQVPLPSQIIANCGPMRFGNESRQFGQFSTWLQYDVYTMRDINSCPITVTVSANVAGVAESGLTRTGVFAASASREILVPTPGYYQTRGTHSFSFWIPSPFVLTEVPIALPSTSSIVYIEARGMDDPAYECEVLMQGRWLGGMCELPNCPLIVDGARNGYKLTSVEDGVRFDLNADGVAEQVAWTRRDSDDAFLALDRNGNGRIDDGTELFGNHTPARPDQPDVTTPNGFEALKFVESPVYGQSERNEVISARDAVFSQLVLWRDLNHNGISEPDELEPLSESGIEAIGTEYKNSKRVDKYGNEFRQRSRVKWSDGQYDHIFDVWLQWRD